jgi:hypothetical protein
MGTKDGTLQSEYSPLYGQAKELCQIHNADEEHQLIAGMGQHFGLGHCIKTRQIDGLNYGTFVPKDQVLKG